jgi:thiol:disulfide interchange protein DsbD
MKKFLPALFAIFFIVSTLTGRAQDTAYRWKVTSERIDSVTYSLSFSTEGNSQWQLFDPNSLLSDVPSSQLEFTDSSIRFIPPFKVVGSTINIQSPLFDNANFAVYEGTSVVSALIRITGVPPAQLLGTFRFTYGKGEALYPLTPYTFAVDLEGGKSAQSRIVIPTFDLDNPVSNAGDESAAGKGLFTIFLLGLVGGLIALVTPCVFPLIPLTVSFFTKQSGSRGKGVFNAVLYGFFIFLIYVLLSIPFHFVDQSNPEILNSISTSVWLNLLFFAVFVVFAISFFGYFEISLPGSIANRADSKSGVGNIAGIFFMALTLAIVSFSCTGPILGTLLVGAGAISNSGGAMQLTSGMAGFGLGLALPFAIFAMFPSWLQSLPKSGGWLNSVKVVLGFLELAMAVKFLSNADLVQQWGILKREIFIGIWVVIGFFILAYLFGKVRFPHDSPVTRFNRSRLFFIFLFTAMIIYLLPGLSNTRGANLQLISGFPPPLCYSVYRHPVNCEKGIEPLRDYEEALALAKNQNKPLLIDFTGWACVNCRRMEENVWIDPEVTSLMKNEFVVVSLYVDERSKLPAAEQFVYTTKNGNEKKIVTVGDKWATFQSENFNAVAQPQYAMISPDERILTKTKSYTPDAEEFAEWLRSGLEAFRSLQ